MLIGRAGEGDSNDAVEYVPPISFRPIPAAHEILDRTTLQPSAFESHTHLAHSVVRYLGVASPQELEPYGLTSAGDLVDLISRVRLPTVWREISAHSTQFTTNTFTLTAPSLTPIGICVSPAAAFCNHSCDPNAVIVFPRLPSSSASQEPLLHLVALQDVAQGKEVRFSKVIALYLQIAYPASRSGYHT